MVRSGVAWLGEVWCRQWRGLVDAWLGKSEAWLGDAWQGKARPVLVWRGSAWVAVFRRRHQVVMSETT